MIGFDPTVIERFPGQQHGETVELMTTYHWISFIPDFFKIFTFTTIFLLIIAFTNVPQEFSPEIRFYIFMIILAILIHWICFCLYNYFLKIILITNMRVIEIENTVFLRREQDATFLTHIQDVKFHQHDIIQRIFRFGDLVILGGSNEVKHVLCYVPKVHIVHDVLSDLHQKALENTGQVLKSY